MHHQPLEEGEVFMPRSRWDSIEGYLATTKYNDKEEPYNREVFEQLRKEGQFSYLSVPNNYYCENSYIKVAGFSTPKEKM
jgi:hypothetical protein